MSSVNTTTLELMYYCNMFRLRRVILKKIDRKKEHTPTPPPPPPRPEVRVGRTTAAITTPTAAHSILLSK